MNPEITFNVIFVRDTVHILAWLLHSLEAWSTNCRFRLVSNGCREPENQILKQMCVGNKRLEFQQFSRDKVLEHGKVLTQLQRQERSPYFAFMDSDILAVGSFLPEFVNHLSTASAVFSCPPVWSNDEFEVMTEGFHVISGQHNRFSDGFCLGSSYFAIYDNSTLSQCMTETGITFRTYWWDRIPTSIQEELSIAGRTATMFDTGKLLNIVLGLRGCRLQFVRSKHLEHVGGISAEMEGRRRRLFGLWPPGISHTLPAFVLRFLQRIGWYQGATRFMAAVEGQRQRRRIQRRHRVCSYLTRLLRSLVNGEKWSESFIDDDPLLTKNVRLFEAQLGRAFERSKTQRPSAAA